MQQENERSERCKGFVANQSRKQDNNTFKSPLCCKAQGPEAFPG